MTDYYQALRPKDFVVFVDRDKAHDALLIRLDSEGRADMLYVDGEPDSLRATMASDVPHLTSRSNPPYWWRPGEPNVTGTPEKENADGK